MTKIKSEKKFLIVGITGSVASGKNFIAKIFQDNGFVIFDADCEIHKLFECENIIKKIINIFGREILQGNIINREILGQIVFNDSKKLLQLEAIMHKELQLIYQNFLHMQFINNQQLIALNIPLLLEKKNYQCDKIISAICGYKKQKSRFIAREISKLANKQQEMQIEVQEKIIGDKFEKIIKKQFDNKSRKKYCDFIIKTDVAKHQTIAKTIDVINKIKQEFFIETFA